MASVSSKMSGAFSYPYKSSITGESHLGNVYSFHHVTKNMHLGMHVLMKTI